MMDKKHKSQSEVILPVKDTKFSRHPLYGKFSILLLAVIIVSLLPHYAKIFHSPELVSASFIVHAIVYLGWFILFVVQANLVTSGNISTHKKLGYISLVLFVLMLISGISMLIGIMESYDSSWEDWYLRSRTNLIWGVFHTLICFVIFYLLGFFFRKQLHLHKRFMLLASLSMISASVTRVAFLPFIPIDGTLITLLSTYVLLLTPMIMDRVIFKSIHPVFKWSVPIYIITQIVCIGILPNTEIGRALAFPL
jgi:hypothetical protein